MVKTIILKYIVQSSNRVRKLKLYLIPISPFGPFLVSLYFLSNYFQNDVVKGFNYFAKRKLNTFTVDFSEF